MKSRPDLDLIPILSPIAKVRILAFSLGQWLRIGGHILVFWYREIL